MRSIHDKLTVVVPARLGSNRVKGKNFRLLNGAPLICHIIRRLKQTQWLRNVCINSDSELFARLAAAEGVGFYHRPKELATSGSPIDEYIYEFIKSTGSDHLAVVNPSCPFVEPERLDQAWRQYVESDCDTQLSGYRVQTHCFYQGKALNFSTVGKLPRSQDLDPVLALNFAITIWDCRKYVANYESEGYGVFTGKLGFFEVEENEIVDVDYEQDFVFAEFVARFLEQGRKVEAQYPEFFEEYLREHPDIQN